MSKYHPTPIERFNSKVRKTDGCWYWTASVSKPGEYGLFSFNGKLQAAHRVSYILFIGEIPEGFVVDHLCSVKGCVNPKHLEAVTVSENVRRSIERPNERGLKTVCKNGHKLSPDNLRIYTAMVGVRLQVFRDCRECNRARGRRWLAKKNSNSTL